MMIRRSLVVCLTSALALACSSDDDGTTPSSARTPTPEQKAVALLAAFETGDPLALDYVSDTYTQHNPNFPDGKAVLSGFFTGEPTGFTTKTARVFRDGDVVFAHSEYAGAWNDGTPQVAFDVFRFDSDGRIAEHWDNLADVVDDGDGTTQVDGPVEASEESSDGTRALVRTAIEQLFIAGTWSTLDTYFDLDNFVQHSSGFGPDASGLEGALGALADGTPFYSSLEYVYAQGNFALTMSQGFPDADSGLPTAYYDLFRVDNGKIVEHWDIVQTIPGASDSANQNGKW